MAMKRVVWLALAAVIAIGARASAQAPAQSAGKPQSGAAAKPGAQAKSTSTVARSPYDRALLRPALLKDKAPETYQVKFTTTRGEFILTVTRAWAPIGVVEGDGMNVVEMMYSQYGDNAGPDQDQIQKQGKPYLDKGWPKLDSIKSATVVAPAGSAGAKPSAAPAAKKP